MTAKEYLMQVFHINRRIDSKLEQLTRLREAATKATVAMSGMPRGGGTTRQPMADCIVKLVDLEIEITREIDMLVDVKAAARIAINAMADPEQQLVLELRYLCQKSWEEVSDSLGFGLSNVYRIHDLALNNFKTPEDWSKIY